MCAREEEFSQFNTRVLIISFGTLPAVREWMQEACRPFTVLLDRERTVYKAYELERSFWRSRNLKTRWLYLTTWLSGKEMHSSHGDDTSQLGGDFIVDKNGILQLIYPSIDPTDRPDVDDLLSVIKALP